LIPVRDKLGKKGERYKKKKKSKINYVKKKINGIKMFIKYNKMYQKCYHKTLWFMGTINKNNWQKI